jgi:hypothetical protein
MPTIRSPCHVGTPCIDCWHDFCVNAVREGPVCVKTTCPGGVCNEVVTEDEMTRALEAGSTGTSSGAAPNG